MIKFFNNKINKKNMSIMFYTFIIMICFGVLGVNVYAENVTNIVSGDFDLQSYSSENSYVEYGTYLEVNGESKKLTIVPSKFKLPENLNEFEDNIKLRIKYNSDTYEVIDCKVLDRKTGSVIEDISAQNIAKLYDVTYGKKVNEGILKEEIYLSELNEDEVYKFSSESKVDFKGYINDTGKNCLIYLRTFDFGEYDKKISMIRTISTSERDNINKVNGARYTLSFFYKTLSDEELLKNIPEREVIFLSKYKDGEQVDKTFKKYVYNDTDKDIVLKLLDIYNAKGSDKEDKIQKEIIKKGEICGFDWMVDSAIMYYEDSKNIRDIKDNNEDIKAASNIDEKEKENDKEKPEIKKEKEQDDNIKTIQKDSDIDLTIMLISMVIIIIISVIVIFGKKK